MLIAWLAPLAAAGDAALLIVADADPSAALARASAATGLPPDAFVAKRLVEVLPVGQPLAVVGASRPPDLCNGPPSGMAQVKTPLDAAESSVAYLDFDKGAASLEEAAGAIACLSEPVDPVAAARVYYLLGVVRYALGQTGTAEEAFRFAYAYDPTLAWDPNFAPDAIGLFEKAAVREGKARIVVAPATASAWVDGRPALGVTEVAAGLHTVQFGDPFTTLRVDVAASETIGFVRPGGISGELVRKAGDPAHQGELGVVLAVAAGEGNTLYVDDGTTVWKTVAGTGVFEAPVPAPVSEIAPPIVPTDGGLHPPDYLGIGLTAGGGAVLGIGVIGSAFTFSKAKGAQRDFDDAKARDAWPDIVAAKSDYDGWKGKLAVTRIVAIAGLGLTAGGVAVLATPLSVTPGPVGDGFGLVIGGIR